MKVGLPRLTLSNVTVGCAAVLGCALSLSAAALSIFSVLTIALGIAWYIRNRQPFPLRQHWPMLLLVILMLLPIHASNLDDFEVVLRKLPLAFLAIACTALPLKTNWRIFLDFMLVSALIAGVWTLADYLLHFSAYNSGLVHSKGILIPTGVNHIYFSLIAAISALYAISRAGWRGRSPKMYGVAMVVLLIVLHTVCARTGLLAFHVGLGVWLMSRLWNRRKYAFALLLPILLMLALITAFLTLPPLKVRLQNAQEDITRYSSNGDVNHRSISTRLIAAELAWDIFLTHPIVGVGIGNLQEEMNKRYLEQYPDLTKENRILPHQQFLLYAAGLGILGPLLLLTIFVLAAVKSDPLALGFLTIFFLAMLAEAILERQVGIALFASMIGLMPAIRRDIAQQ